MNYYKLVSNGKFVGVASQNDFRVFQHKHKIILECDEEVAQYVQVGDEFYRANWMVPINTDMVPYSAAEVIKISKEEFDILYSAVENGEDIIVGLEHDTVPDSTHMLDPNEEITVDYVKSAKTAEMRYTCNKVIEDGVDVLLSDGNIYHFSLTTQDQLNLITLQSMIASGETAIPYHADGELCRYYSVEDIKMIIDAATAHTTFHVTYFNSLKMYIGSLLDIADVSVVDYGMNIPEEYQSDILKTLYASMCGENNEESH